jgi:hypothetical protein
MNEQINKQRRGCLFYGGIALVVLLLFILVAALVGAHMARKMLNEYTDAQPMVLPTSTLPASQADEAVSRVKAFEQAVGARRATPPLELNADQINALIATDPRYHGLKGKVWVALDGDKVKGTVSLPMTQFGMGMFRGRFLNAEVTLVVAFQNGLLQIIPDAITVKGKPLPGIYMNKIRQQEFARELTQNPGFLSAAERLQNIEIKDGKLIITTKQN